MTLNTWYACLKGEERVGEGVTLNIMYILREAEGEGREGKEVCMDE